MSVRMFSRHMSPENDANVPTYGRSPHDAIPAAAAIMFRSEMPNWKNRVGWRASNAESWVDTLRSADGCRAAMDVEVVEGAQEGADVVAVHLEDPPPERRPLQGERRQVQDLPGRAVNLDRVPVGDRQEMGQAAMRRVRGGLPHLA